MKLVNGWNAKTKQVDKFIICLRFGWVTVFEFYLDLSDKNIRLGLFNLFVEK